MTRILLAIYSLALSLALPFYRWCKKRSGRVVAPAHARSRDFPVLQRDSIWLHAVSVGELLSLRSLIPALAVDHPDCDLVISTTTSAGHDLAEKTFPDHHCIFCPYDLKTPVRRALKRLRPRVLILTELEVWPRLLDECQRGGVPVILVGGRISERSLRGYRRLLWVLPRLFQPFRYLLVQDKAQSDRFQKLGIDAAQIRVTGSIKVDNLPATVFSEAVGRLRHDLGLQGKLVFLAGSTHEGEEELVFKATLAIRSHMSNMVLVLAPRHLERLQKIEELAQGLGLTTRRRSAKETADKSVILVDTMGELATLFATADLAFLGGSLVPKGGHNVLEPAAAGCVQLIGPHHWTAAEYVAELEAVGALEVVHDEFEMAAAVERRFSQPEDMLRAARAAQDVVARHRGATERTRTIIREVLLPRERTDDRQATEA